MQGKVIGHRNLPHVVVTRYHTARQIVEEAEDSHVLIVNGKEVVIRECRTSATVKHPFPAIFGSKPVCKLIGQIGLLIAFVPRQVYKHIGIGIISILVINPYLTVPNVDCLLIAPVVTRKVRIIYVEVNSRSPTIGGIVPPPNHGGHCIAGSFQLERTLSVVHINATVSIIQVPSFKVIGFIKISLTIRRNDFTLRG